MPRGVPGPSNKGEVLTDVMIAEIREIFSLFDKDADGFVETGQLGTIIRGLNMNPSETEVAEMQKDVDPEGRGTFNQNALCSLIARRPKQEDSLEDMVESLKILCAEQAEDKQLQLKIEVGQFRYAMANQNKNRESLLDHQIEAILTDCKLIHEDNIVIEDFAKYLMSR